jgi:L-2,4-diaminobutyrate decarboxylase
MERIQAAFDPQAFRTQGHRVVDQLADYLDRALHGQSLPVLPPSDPVEMLASWPGDFAENPAGDLVEILARVLAEANHLHRPRYVGHQVNAPLPVAALCELVAAFLNNGMAVYEMGPSATAMERQLVRWMARMLGLGGDADGVLTSGGSARNLTALLAARQAKAGFDAWAEGNSGGPPLTVLASDQSHYSVRRAVQIMGWGDRGILPVATDTCFRLRADHLPAALRRAKSGGRKVIAVVATACSTATGAFDPLDAIADFCAQHDLWFHVDGAHGASAALSDRYRHLLAGIERADSVVWDAHKMLLMPALVTAVLFRSAAHSYEAFAQQASYLFNRSEHTDEHWADIGARTLECTKRMMSLKLYAALSLYGTRMFSDYITATFDLARRFAAQLQKAADFELAVEPEANIVCFRHTPAGTQNLDERQQRVRQRLLASGSFYVVQTRLPAGVFLRTTLINPFTTDDDLAALLETIRDLKRRREFRPMRHAPETAC